MLELFGVLCVKKSCLLKTFRKTEKVALALRVFVARSIIREPQMRTVWTLIALFVGMANSLPGRMEWPKRSKLSMIEHKKMGEDPEAAL